MTTMSDVRSLHGTTSDPVGIHTHGVVFDVVGTPKPQGSMKAFAVGGHARQKPSGGLEFAAWRNAVSEAARHHAETVGTLDGPLRLNVLFRFEMPKSRSKAAHTAGRAPKTTAPDLDKLVRAVGDALTASKLIRDDSLFVVITAEKIETTEWTGATIVVGPA